MRREDFKSNRAGRLEQTSPGYWAFIPRQLPPDLHYSADLIRLLAEASRALGELAGVGRMLPNPHLLVSAAIRREAVVSSRIEGTETEIEDLFLFEADPRDPRKPDVREVHNYVLALQHGLERRHSLPVSLRLVRELHARLLEGVKGGYATPGEFRRSQNWIGPTGCTLEEATFVPPPEDRLLDCLAQWEAYIHREDPAHPLIRLAVLHYQFEAIHPFLDGNGRVGRLLIALLLVHWGLLPQPLLYLSAFFEEHHDEYMRGLLQVSQLGVWEDWVEFFLRAIREQACDALGAAHFLTELQVRFRELLYGRRISKITLSLLDDLFAAPVTTVSQVRRRYQVSFHTAERAVKDLENIGILRETSKLKRDRVWAARDILDVLSGKRPYAQSRTGRPDSSREAEA